MSIIGYHTTAEQRAQAAADRAARISAKREQLSDRLTQLAKNAQHDDIHNPYDFDDSERY